MTKLSLVYIFENSNFANVPSKILFFYIHYKKFKLQINFMHSVLHSYLQRNNKKYKKQMLVYISFLLELQACISPIIFIPNILLLNIDILIQQRIHVFKNIILILKYYLLQYVINIKKSWNTKNKIVWVDMLRIFYHVEQNCDYRGTLVNQTGIYAKT